MKDDSGSYAGRTPACRGCWTMTWSSAWYYDRATRWWWRPWYPQQEWRLRTRRRRRRRRLGRRWRYRRQWWWRPRETVFTQEYIEEPDNERGHSDFFSECADKFGEIGDVYMDGKKTSGSAPDTMIEHVAPAGSCAASAPVTEHSPTATCAAPDTVIEYVATAGTCAAPAPVTEYVPTAANAAPDTVIEYVAPAGTCAAQASACARCRVHRASTSSVLCCNQRPSCPMSRQRPSSSTACQHQRLPTFHHRACAYQCLCNAGHTDRIRGFGWHMRSTSSRNYAHRRGRFKRKLGGHR